MLKDKVLRVEIIQLHYDVPVAEYREKQKMTKLVTRNYQQPEVIRDVEQYMEEYNMCQRMKNRVEIPVGKLKLSEILEEPQTHLIVDFIAKLQLVARKDAILVVCDRLFKITHFVATTEGTSVEELVRLFRDNI